jgi:RNA polymerase sigma-70 factor (ECF subfamily)
MAAPALLRPQPTRSPSVNAPAPSLDRYRPLLRLHVRQLQLGRLFHARFDSSDVVQEALVRAVKGLDARRGADEPQLVRWLQEIVRNTFVDLLRKDGAARCDPRREQTIHDAAGDEDTPLAAYLAASQPGPSTLAVRKEELLRLAAAVDQLPDAERDAVIAHYILELPLAEVAARMGRTVKGVAGLLYRGKERLRASLATAGAES